MRSDFHDLPADSFPFRIEFLDRDGVVVHQIEVDGPGGMHIPALSGRYGPISTRITFPDGEVVEVAPPDERK
jgi:hypothetical protein